MQPHEKFVSPHAPPQGAAGELLVVLMEECAEIAAEFADASAQLARLQQRAAKALRFGLPEIQPGQPWTNAERLAREIGDLNEVVARLLALGVLDAAAIAAGRENKARQLAKYLQCQSPPAPTDSVGENAPSAATQ